jgi:hypothetical protein
MFLVFQLRDCPDHLQREHGCLLEIRHVRLFLHQLHCDIDQTECLWIAASINCSDHLVGNIRQALDQRLRGGRTDGFHDGHRVFASAVGKH